ncbi:MAG: cobalt-precorrin-7 (C(5))-methyltransferase, partial [Methanoregulaceae archaeon]|nr:cobalt-precorrin-7 (C(5))-methyltransferase [Methanoregulaceae archaeon]
MKIVGVGCGPGMLSDAARKAIGGATEIYGSMRAIELVREEISLSANVTVITDYHGLRELPGEAVVLSTGDPMLAGLGYLGGEVIPGISSLQVACSRLRISLVRVAVVDAHGTDHDKAVLQVREELRRGKVVFLLSMPGFDPAMLTEGLCEPAGGYRIALCEE